MELDESSSSRSLLPENEHFSRRILSRSSSSTSPSLRIYYAENPAAVPFQWEAAPGTPKPLPEPDPTCPPLIPPPAMQSARLAPGGGGHCRKGKARKKYQQYWSLRSWFQRYGCKGRGKVASSAPAPHCDHRGFGSHSLDKAGGDGSPPAATQCPGSKSIGWSRISRMLVSMIGDGSKI